MGPNTSRERNPIIKDPDSFFNGYKHILTKLAGLYSRD
ncbi:hypothetical protein TASI_0849 [Taylorella asinigenitalis MCE3]|uniref:Uncharacterized protein n=1 Tax=Taylorella asinigenitalis (strain MCE3) TaxID=1008459 RepID=G4Q9K2_TAYAM|nr:hypothetical protein TASI_0849 [Taylorella asinigenitalis MCE3]